MNLCDHYITRDGITYRIKLFQDDYADLPWESWDGSGVVEKKPGPGRLRLGASGYFYNFPASVERAKRDGWGYEGMEKDSPKKRASKAALNDYKFLNEWGLGNWEFAVLEVTRLENSNGELLNESEPVFLAGIEYWRDYDLNHEKNRHIIDYMMPDLICEFPDMKLAA